MKMENYQESKYLTKEQWEKWNDYVKTGKIDGKKENNIFAVARYIGTSVAKINSYEIEQRAKKNKMATGGNIPYDLKVTGIYTFKTTSGKEYKFAITGFEREDDTEWAFYFSDWNREENNGLRSVIVKNSAIRKMAKGETVTATTKAGEKGKLTRVGDSFMGMPKMADGGGVDNKEINSNNYEKVIEEINYEFSRIQTKNIKLIVGKIINKLSGKYDGFSSGGGISHIFLQLKDNTWIGFHNEFGDITISSPFPTLNKLINAWNSDDWEKVTGNSLKNYKSNQTFDSIDVIVSDIKNKSFSSAKYSDGGSIDDIKLSTYDFKTYVTTKDGYGGEVIFGSGKVQGVNKRYVSHINWEGDEPKNSEEIEDFVSDNIDYLLQNIDEYAKGGSIKNNNDYMRATDKYDLLGALLDDAREENNTTEITKLREQMEKLETEINRYERNYAKGGGVGKTKKDFVEYLNEIGVPDYEHPENNGRVSWSYVDKYGEWLRKNDSIAFEAGYSEWKNEYADGGSVGEIEAKIADFRRRAENKSIPESAKNKFLSMAEELEKTLPKAEKKEEAKAEKPKFKVGDVVVLQGGDALPKKITSIKENKKGEIIYSGYYESKPSEKFSYDGTELVIFKKPKKEFKEKAEKGESKKAELSEKDCIDLLEKYKAEREARKERAEKREKQGKPAELTPAETAKKAVDRVTDKIEAKAEKGKSVKGDIKAVFSQFKSAVAELKKYKNEIDEKEVRNLIKELESLLNK